MRDLPTYDQVLALPAGPRAPVPAEYADSNGHLNVRHHLALYDDAEWALYDPLDLGEAHALAGLGGIFALEQHVTYRREVLVGEEVAVHVRLLGRSEKLLHLVSYLVNHTRAEVAGSLEALEAYVDFGTRRIAPIPDGATAALDAFVTRAAALGWSRELSGCLALPQDAPERLR